MSARILDPLRFPLHGSRLIEASAGTGKTYTIAALYLRLVLGHGGDAGYTRPLQPPEILVVTFTEAATEELRERIRARLAEAARAFRGQGPADAFLAALMADGPPAGWPGCARRLELAAEGMDEAAVSTIHGWCQRMLKEHAFDSGSLFQQELQTDDAELLLEAARDYWRCHFYPLPPAALPALRTLAATPEDLLARIAPLLRNPEARHQAGGTAIAPLAPERCLGEWLSWRQGYETQERRARAAWDQDRTALAAMLAEAMARGWLKGNIYKPQDFAAQLAALAAWAAGGTAEAKLLERYGQSRLTPGAGLKKDAPALEHPAFAALDALAERGAEEPAYAAGLLAHAAAWIAQRLEADKRRLALLGFDDLLKGLDRALAGPNGERLAAVIRRQFPVALIDEFQDTDPVQYRIFERVYAPGESAGDAALLLIGDPKQAIYAFRGADIHTYLRARAATAGRHYTLARNFRSTEALVAAVNRVFAQGEALPGGAFLFQGEDGDNPLPFLEVSAQGRGERLEIAGAEQPALTAWHWRADEPIGAAEYRAGLAEACAGEIARLLTLAAERPPRAGFRRDGALTPLQPADIAVLVRTGTEAAALRAALERRGLPCVYLSDKDSVYASAEAADVLRWLRACAEPERDRLLRAALASASLDLSYAELDTLNQDELAWEARVEQFRTYGELWRRQGVLPLLHRLVHDFDLARRCLGAPGGERRLTNVLHLAELLQRAGAELDGELALIRHLAEHSAAGSQAAEEQVLRLESDAGRIKLVTIHKSKGLEYPLVFLPYACAFREITARAGSYRYHDGTASVLELDAKDDAAKAAADAERLQEDLRLLYVALTRARHGCWLGLAPLRVHSMVKDTELHKSAIGYLLGATAKAKLAAAELGPRLAALRGDCPHIAVAPLPDAGHARYLAEAEAGALEPARRYTGARPQAWWIASYSALRLAEAEAGGGAELERMRELRHEAAAAPAQATGLHGFPHGPKAGVFLHGLLEWAARDGLARAATEPARRKEAIARRCNRRDWERWIEPLSDWLGEVLAAPLSLPDGTVLRLAELSGAQPELEFWFAAEGVDLARMDGLITAKTLDAAPRPALAPGRLNGMLKGYMDLVFEHGGRYYVADYKSNYLGADDGAYHGAALREAVLAARYELQYVLYVLALHRLLKLRLPGYDYERHVGGAVYLFLRGLTGGAGVHVDKPPRALIEALDALFAGEDVHDVA